MYLLTSAISTPIYGKLSDLYGRKNILSIGVVIFLLGSIVNFSIVRYFSNLGIKGVDPDNLYSSTNLNTGLSLGNIKASLFSGIHLVFTILIVVSAVCFLLSFSSSNRLKEKAVS